MAATGALLAVVFVLVAAVAPLVLYAFVRAEHDEREEMRREQAEEAARRDRP